MGSLGFPTLDPQACTPLPLHRVLRGEFPCCIGTMRVCDSLCPSHRAWLPSLGDTMGCACRFAPCGPERPTAGRGFSIRSPYRKKQCPWRQSGPPRFPRNPCVPTPCSSTPAGPTRQALRRSRRGPRYVHDEGSHDGTLGAQSHGLGTRCLRFVGWVTPALHARLASRCWPLYGDGIGYPQDSAERFQTKSSPFLELCLAQGHRLLFTKTIGDVPFTFLYFRSI